MEIKTADGIRAIRCFVDVISCYTSALIAAASGESGWLNISGALPSLLRWVHFTRPAPHDCGIMIAFLREEALP